MTTRPPESGPPWAPGYGHLTADVEPVAFRFRVLPEDFRVTEEPLEPPTGEGSHVWFRIEKRGLGTPEAVERIARALGRSGREVGYAGRKDGRAVTRQWLSLEHVEPATVAALAWEDLRVLEVARSRRRLRVGQLAGNRFELVLREVEAGGEERVARVLAHLARTGVPNYYGSQRFGRRGLTWRLGALLVAGRHEEYVHERVGEDHALPGEARDELERVLREGSRGDFRRLARLAPRLEAELADLARQLARRPRDWNAAVRSVSRRVRAFHLSALQSRIFNRVLAARLGELDRVLPGDLLVPPAPRPAEPGRDPREGQRVEVPLEGPLPEGLREAFERRELVPSGPLPGGGSPLAAGRPGELERQALAREGLALEDLVALPHGLAPRGARRPLLVPLTDLEQGPGPDPGTLRLAFALPAGSYATTVLEELLKEHRAPENGQAPGPGGRY